jgi:hypothetical protein
MATILKEGGESMEFERRPKVRFVTDAERAARIQSNNNNLNEVVEPKGEFNGPGGRTYHTEEAANAALQAEQRRQVRGQGRQEPQIKPK